MITPLGLIALSLLCLWLGTYLEGPGSALRTGMSPRYAVAAVVALPLCGVALDTADLRLV